MTNVKIYNNNQWTELIIVENDNYTYYKLHGEDNTGTFENFNIIIKSVTTTTSTHLHINPINIFSECVRKNKHQELPLLFLHKIFSANINYYVLQNNFSLWNNTPQFPQLELDLLISPNLNKFDKDELLEIKQMFITKK